jgi:hypothetical protein
LVQTNGNCYIELRVEEDVKSERKLVTGLMCDKK